MALAEDDPFDHGEGHEVREPYRVTCKRCGKSGLHWVEYYSSKFKLFDGPREHICKAVDASGDFAALD